MLQQILLGILFGWGAAIPIGPINIEIMRRNLRFGTLTGLVFGFGACMADVTYLVLLSLSALMILNHPSIIQMISIIGSLILMWFGVSALRMPIKITGTGTIVKSRTSLLQQWLTAYMMTLFSPFTFLFWTSMSAQVVGFSQEETWNPVYVGLGVILGICSWDVALNGFLHITRHRLSPRVIHLLNYSGGLILLGFAIFILARAFL